MIISENNKCLAKNTGMFYNRMFVKMDMGQRAKEYRRTQLMITRKQRKIDG